MQSCRLARFDGKLLIREVEPEVSYIDQLYVMIMQDDGGVKLLPAPLDVLREADDRYLILAQGEQLLLHFADYSPLSDHGQTWVVAEGYYVPLRKGWVEAE